MRAPAVLNMTGVNFYACLHVLSEIHIVRTITNYILMMNFAGAINKKCSGDENVCWRDKLLISLEMLQFLLILSPNFQRNYFFYTILFYFFENFKIYSHFQSGFKTLILTANSHRYFHRTNFSFDIYPRYQLPHRLDISI